MSISGAYPSLRPWRTLIMGSFSLPHSLSSRLRHNLSHFQSNYALISLLILFLSLLFHPLSLLAFLPLFLASLPLYFSRSRPLVLLRRPLPPRLVLFSLFTVTVVVLVFTGVWLNVLVSAFVAGFVVGAHAAFRVPEDLFLDEDEAASGGLLSVVGGSPPPARSSRSTPFASV